jgi:GTP cyclohydrolase I
MKLTEHIYDDEVTETLSKSFKTVIDKLGEDSSREGLLKTPERASKAMQFLTHGYDLDADDILNQAIFHEEYSEMVIVKDIEVYSLCEHHMLPFFGKAHVAYIPDGKIVGLSKIPRVIEASHMCMQMRGVQKQNSVTTSSAFTGLFMTNDSTRKEFINLIQAKLH